MGLTYTRDRLTKGAPPNVTDFSHLVTSDDWTTAIQAALDRAEATGAGLVLIPAGRFKVTSTLRFPDGVILEGAGHGFWDIIFHNRAKSWSGTTLLFSGTGLRDKAYYGITSMKYAGGRRTDPDNPAVSYSMTSLMNADASGATRATPRAFSAAIMPKTAHGSSHWGLRNIRLCPWMGTDGYTDYSNTANTGLGDDWDFGICLVDSEYCVFEQVQCVGYWRIAAASMLCPGLVDYSYSERNVFRECKLQGYVGLLIRSGDTWSVTSKTGSTVVVRYSEEHYWPTSGTFEAPGNLAFAYTGLSFAGTSLTFTGVTPDPNAAGISQIRNPRRGTGYAGCQIENTFMQGLDHVSGAVATAKGFATASRCLEMSGYPMRGIQFFNAKCQTHEKITAYLHDCNDMLWHGGHFEGSTSFLIASPQNIVLTAADALCPAADGDTSNLRFHNTLLSSTDTRLFQPRSLYDDMRTINPQARNSGEFVIEPLTDQDMIVRLPASTNSFKIQNRSALDILEVSEARMVTVSGTTLTAFQVGPAAETIFNVDAGQGYQWKIGGTVKLLMFSSGNTEISAAFRPSATNTYNCGSSTQYWLNGYITTLNVTNVTFTTGPVIKTGTGTPEAAVAAPVGSVFLRTDGGAGTSIYVKETGAATSAGWVAK